MLEIAFGGAPVFAGICLLLGAILLVATFPKERSARLRLLWLLLLPLPLIATRCWAEWFWVDWQKPNAVGNPAWVAQAFYVALIASVVLPLALVVRLKGARLLTLLFGLANAGFTLPSVFIGWMAVTGVWL